MKIALCTTTIHVPHALKLLRKCSDDVRFFVACDHKTPVDVVNLGNLVGNAQIICPTMSESEWKCEGAIGWNTLARRNIAFLEALKWGADVIYSWDNDNLPINTDHFNKLEDIFVAPFNGVGLGNGVGLSWYDWFDPGSLLIPTVRHRGFPFDMPHRAKASSAIDAKIGVAAGLVLGNPDIDATHRMELKPDIAAVCDMARAGIIIDPQTWTVFNSQNTAMIRNLIPAWFMMPGVGRYDDIYASLIVQRVIHERDLYVHFGPPFTYQQRNEHDLIADLRAEIDGMENVTKLAELLSDVVLPVKSVIDDVRVIYKKLYDNPPYVPHRSIDAALLWLEDCESVL